QEFAIVLLAGYITETRFELFRFISMSRLSRFFPLRLLIGLILAAALSAAGITCAAERAALAAARASITAADLKHHVEVLADDSFEGREAGSRGGHAAGLY